MFAAARRVQLVRKERLELSRVTPLVPKTSASTNSATFARFVSGHGSAGRNQRHYTRLNSQIDSPRAPCDHATIAIITGVYALN